MNKLKLFIVILLFPVIAFSGIVTWEMLPSKFSYPLCYRMPIYDGWLVQCGQGLTFVPDKLHEWEL